MFWRAPSQPKKNNQLSKQAKVENDLNILNKKIDRNDQTDNFMIIADTSFDMQENLGDDDKNRITDQDI